MQFNLPNYRSGHIVAIAGVFMLHTGLAAWAILPEPPVVLPAQQVIQVSMVAPTVIKQDFTIQSVEVAKERLSVPPQEKGMVKQDKEQRSVEEKKDKNKETKQKISSMQPQTKLTSGLQSADASQQESAVTEPVAASYLKNQPPKYPISALKNKQQGTVLLEIKVSVEGEPRSVIIEKSSGFEMLDEAAIAAVKQWKFIPARRGSSVVEANVIVPIKFKLNS